MSAFTLEELTSQLQSQTGMPYDKARRIAEVNLGITPASALAHEAAQQPAGATIAPPASTRPPKRRKSPEKREEEAIDEAAIKRGAFVYRFSQPRESMQTPGIPDRYFVWPHLSLWWEIKSPTGVLSQAQAKFAMQCAKNGTPYGCGTHQDFLDWCHRHGVKP